MKDIFSEKFKENCYLDICEILSFVNEFLPNLEKWQMTNSVFIEENKKITYKTLKDKKGDLTGYELLIEIYLDKLHKYNLIIKKDMLDLSINYTEDNKNCRERYKTSIENSTPRRLCSYKKGLSTYKYSEVFNSNESLYCINSKFKKMEVNTKGEEKVLRR